MVSLSFSSILRPFLERPESEDRLLPGGGESHDGPYGRCSRSIPCQLSSDPGDLISGFRVRAPAVPEHCLCCLSLAAAPQRTLSCTGPGRGRGGGGAQARVRGGVGLLAGDSVLQIPYFWFARGRQPGRSPSAPLLPRLPPPRRAPGSGVGVSRGCGHLRCAASAPAAARPNNPRLTLYPKRRKTVRASFGGRSPASCKLCLRSS